MKNSGSFRISALNIDCGCLLELPQGGSSNKYPQYMFLSRNKKTTRIFHLKDIYTYILSAHNMFSWQNKKNIETTPSYLELCNT